MHKAGILSGLGGEEGQGIEKNQEKLTPFEES